MDMYATGPCGNAGQQKPVDSGNQATPPSEQQPPDGRPHVNHQDATRFGRQETLPSGSETTRLDGEATV